MARPPHQLGHARHGTDHRGQGLSQRGPKQVLVPRRSDIVQDNALDRDIGVMMLEPRDNRCNRLAERCAIDDQNNGQAKAFGKIGR